MEDIMEAAEREFYKRLREYDFNAPVIPMKHWSEWGPSTGTTLIIGDKDEQIQQEIHQA